MDDNPVVNSEETARQTSFGPVRHLHVDLRQSAPENTVRHDRHRLTPREGVIVAFIGTGRSNKEIARELGVTPETIKSHLKRIFLKLSASTRAEAVARARGIDLVVRSSNSNSLSVAFGQFPR